MRYLWAGLIIFACARVAVADDAAATAAPPSDARAAIDRGLAFLVKDAQAWRDEHHCVSCHHASLVVMALREAKDHGHSIDEPMFAELTKWVAEAGDGK